MVDSWFQRGFRGARRHRTEILSGVAIFVAAFMYVLPEASALIDDHFMHVAWGRQLLYGRQPLLDTEALGVPLQASLSALSERLVGYRLLSEGLIVGGAFAAGAVLTFAAARIASGSLAIGTLAAALQLAISPRTYSYPKIVVYAAAVLLLWHYIAKPSNRRAAVVGIGIVVGFYLRHDHGIYVGLVTVAVLVLQHSPDWRIVLRRLTWLGATCALLVAPYLVYIHRHSGVVEWVQNLRSISLREYQQNKFDSMPEWPLASRADFLQWQRERPRAATIGVRWNAGASDNARRVAARRYGLQLEPDVPIESGRFLLTDVSTVNVLAMLEDPVIEDTAGVDRQTGAVPLQGLWLGPLHVLSGLDRPFASAAFLFFGFIAMLLLSLIAAVWPQREARRMPAPERTMIVSVVLVGVAAALGFIREPLAIRIPDAVVAPAILAAWWAGKAGRQLRASSRSSVRIGGVFVATVVLTLVTRAVVVLGAVPTRLDAVRHFPRIAQQLLTTPPIDAVGSVGRVKYKAVRYVRDCTAEREPLLVLWFAPDLYYYSNRPFAGRLGFYMEGYWTSERSESLNIAVIERDRPTIALIESDREVTDLYTYPRLLSYLADFYHPLGLLSSNDDRTIRVLARNDRSPTSIDSESGWPCYR
jgi:hypothetical protein